MARTKKVEEPQEEVQEVPTPQPPTVKQIPDGFQLPPDGKLIPVKCTLPGFEHLTVHFKINNPWRFVHEAESIPNEDGFRYARQVMLVARRFEGWNFVDELTLEPIPVPTVGNLDSYKPLALMYGEYGPLGQWCTTEGYRAALDSVLKN